MSEWPRGTDLVAFDTIDSTMDEARRRVAAGEHGPVWLAARRQTAGRGRQGRHWSSPYGNLSATGLFPIDATPAQAAQLSFVAALAVVDLLDTLAPGADIGLKWPNDVLLNRRKAAGILLENLGTAPHGITLAVGIGLNLAHHPPEADANWPPTSILRETGQAPDFDRTLLLLAQYMDRRMVSYAAQGFPPVRAAWLKRAIQIGGPVEVRLPNATLSGRFNDLDADGALVLEGPDGLQRVSAGDVYFPEATGAA